MKIFRVICKNLIYSFLSLILVFALLLFIFLVIDNKVSIVISSLIIILSFGLFCYCVYRFISIKNSFRFLFFQGFSGLLSLASLSVVVTFITIFFFSISLMISSELGKNLTIEEKVELYILPLQNKTNPPINYQSMKKGKQISSFQNVNIYYQTNEKELVPVIKHVLSRADTITTDLFGNVQDNEIDLVLHSSSKELFEQTSLINTMGYFDDPNDIVGVAITNKEEIIADLMPGIFHFQSTIMHEYTHYRLQAFIKEQGLYVYRVPLWFHEGVAEYVGMYDVSHRYSPFKEASFDKLVTQEDWEKRRMEDYDVYLQSYYAIRYIVNQFGEEIIKTIIEETASTNDFNEGFSKATDMTIEELQSEYLNIEKQKGINL